MKTLALGIAVAASLVSSTAMAGEQRPTYIAFKAPTAVANTTGVVAAAPAVAKRDKAIGTIPFYIPLIGLVAVIGIVVAVSGGGNNGSPG